jgi:hypothetical protein
MKRLVFVLFGLAGCADDPGAVEITWSFPPTRTGGCDGDPAVVKVRASINEGSVFRQQEIECRVGQTILIPDVPPGSYALTVDALDADEHRVYSGLVSGLQVDEGKTQSQAVVLEALPGTVRLAWSTPTNCVVDEIHDIYIEVWDGETQVVEEQDQLVPCGDGIQELTGSWIMTADYPIQRLFVFGLDIAGVETHEFANCDLVVESSIENDVTAALTVCPGDPPVCCPSGPCVDREQALCPPG